MRYVRTVALILRNKLAIVTEHVKQHGLAGIVGVRAMASGTAYTAQDLYREARALIKGRGRYFSHAIVVYAGCFTRLEVLYYPRKGEQNDLAVATLVL